MKRTSYHKGNAVDRYRSHQESKKVDSSLAKETVTCCVRTANSGQSCAIIVDTHLDLANLDFLIESTLRSFGIGIVSGGSGGYKLGNGAEIRIFTIDTATHASLLMGDDVRLFHAGDGDERVRKANAVLSL